MTLLDKDLVSIQEVRTLVRNLKWLKRNFLK